MTDTETEAPITEPVAAEPAPVVDPSPVAEQSPVVAPVITPEPVVPPRKGKLATLYVQVPKHVLEAP